MAFLRNIFSASAHAGIRLALVGCLIAFALVATPFAGASDRAPPTREYQVKAAFLIKLPLFVEWPKNTYANDAAPFVIGVVGEDPFGIFLDDLVSDVKIGDRAIVVRRFQHPEDATGCQLIYVSKAPAGIAEKTLEHFRGQSVLTVGDSEGFTHLGGMIRLAIENGKTGLRINPDAAAAAQLKISSKLLRIATIVPTEKN